MSMQLMRDAKQEKKIQQGLHKTTFSWTSVKLCDILKISDLEYKVVVFVGKMINI